MQYGFINVAAASPEVTVGDVRSNLASIKTAVESAVASDAELLVLPELCLTAYT